MNVEGKHYRTIWLDPEDDRKVRIIDQTKLPHEFVVEELTTVDETACAIRAMLVRGAGLIGATAGFGMYLAALEAGEDTLDEELSGATEKLKATRPTAKNLEWAVVRQLNAMKGASGKSGKIEAARKTALEIADEDAEFCRRIGEHGVRLIEEIADRKKGETVHVLTHCNAGWLAFVDYGSATAPIYEAYNRGIDLHVWVDETRPRNQGASLTAWELGMHGVPHDIVVDNAGGHLMQHGMVDLVITGADRVTRAGDAANKIGTYLKGLAAADNGVPFYVALPSSTFDWDIFDGVAEIPIEERSGEEVLYMYGKLADRVERFLICPPKSTARNYGFDVTPNRLIRGLITERGIIAADPESIAGAYPEYVK